jgi:hypothetical protein
MSLETLTGAIASLELIKPAAPSTDMRILCPVGYKQDPSLTTDFQLMRRPVVWNVNNQQYDVGGYSLAEFNCRVDTFTLWTPQMKWNFSGQVVSGNGYDIRIDGIFRMGTEEDRSDWQLEIHAYCPALIGRSCQLYWDKYTRDNYGMGPAIAFGADGWARTGIRHTRISSGKHNIKSNERCAVAITVL